MKFRRLADVWKIETWFYLTDEAPPPSPGLLEVEEDTLARWMIAAFLAVAVGIVPASVAVAAPGQLDPSFGDEGIVSTPVGDISFANAIGRQSDGKLVVAGCSLEESEGGSSQFGIVRYTTGGSLDPSFGNDGVVFVSFPNSSSSSCVEDLAIRPDDAIVLAGSAGSGPDQSFAVAQLTSGGQLDDSFGTDGRVRLHPGNLDGSTLATAIALDPAGRAVIAGQAWTGSRVNGLSVPVFAAVRIESDGTLDTNFGEVVMEMTETFPAGVLPSSAVADIARYPDGRIVLVGTAYDEWQDSQQGFQERLAIVRLDSDGELDPSFSGDGKLVTPVRDVTDSASGNAVALTPDGRITVGGWLNHVSLVARFEQDGEPDLAFGSEGSTLLSDLGGDEAGVQAMRYQSDGKLVTAGVADPPTEFPRFGVARLDVNGEPDPSFGANGVVSGPPFGSGDPWRRAYAYDLVLEPSGNLVVAGRESGEGPENFALARYQGDRLPLPSDRDGDGVPDEQDQCPDVPGVAPTGCPANTTSPVPAPPTSRDFKVRAIGDSVTAGFGYYANGSPVERIAEAYGCRPPSPPDNRCSSPNMVAYPAAWARSHGLDLNSDEFRNDAISGSTPEDWLSGPFKRNLTAVVADNPDVILLTLGGNPLLTDFAFGFLGSARLCMRADWAGERTRKCVRERLGPTQYDVVSRLRQVYLRLVDAHDAHVGILLYHETRPRTIPKDKVRILFTELNAAISTAFLKARQSLSKAERQRLRLIDPGPFAKHECDSRNPWVLNADLCVHPNKAGHEAFARAVEAKLGGLVP